MSKVNSPRVLTVNKLPKGRFTWKIVLQIGDGAKMDSYTRYKHMDNNPLTPQMQEYLDQSIIGKHCIGWINKEEVKNRKEPKKAHYVLFDNQIDVSMFKLCFGDAIRQIYRIQVMEKPA